MYFTSELHAVGTVGTAVLYAKVHASPLDARDADRMDVHVDTELAGTTPKEFGLKLTCGACRSSIARACRRHRS